MEKDDEIRGKGNSFTTEFRQYDSRIGRWLSLDPVTHHEFSPYSSYDNNPIYFIDPYGADVINGDQIAADYAGRKLSAHKDDLSAFMKSHEITNDMKRRDFKKEGGVKSDWKIYKSKLKNVEKLTVEYKIAKARARITGDIIKKWEEESPNLFNEVDKQGIDFALYSVTKYVEPDEAFGGTEPAYFEGEDGEICEPPRLNVIINDRVNLDSKDPEMEQFSLNHEAGHFLYLVNNLVSYINFANSDDYVDGGHGKNDESGKAADNLGKDKDVPPSGPGIE